MIKAVIFDLDDTLTDRPESIRKFAAPFADYFATKRGCISYADALLIRDLEDTGYKPRRELCGDILELLAWTKSPTVDEVLEFWLAEFPRCVVGREGYVEILEELQSRGLAIGMVTNGAGPSQDTKLDEMGIRSYFGSILISEVEGVAKPDEAIFRRSLAALGVGPEEALFVGDNPANDVAGAAAVGMGTVWVRNGRPWPEGLRVPTHAVDSLRDILGLL